MPFTSSYEPVEAGGTTFHELVGRPFRRGSRSSTVRRS